MLLLAALVGGVLLFSPPLRAADPIALACPNGQTVFLEGSTTPREALLVYLRNRPVGGGLARGDGSFSLPLRAQERPGIYPVEVRLRSSRAVVATYSCFVDVALDTAGSPTATLGGATPVSTPRAGPTAQPTAARVATSSPTASPTATSGGGTAATATTTVTTTATVTTTTTVTTTATVTTTPGTPTATTTATTGNTVEIIDIVIRDPAFPNESDEYVQIRNAGDTPINLAGWRLVNTSRPSIAAYVFPSFNLGVDVTIAVFTAVGDDEIDIGDFYWDRTDEVWRVGDRAELRDAQNRVVSSLPVPNQ